ncbi:hypothetical protein N789_06025 [Arenimonas oryziterrae DSM 21050 = YC6267]|uniref:Uncharacterized protein n=1 Tax=Arenimonas oryziterrae DSM 21050 = YC6267 TaxID=1121015 RepID=A0A091AMP8_9GAMM|nr:hypothetical protein N789_06025 [Arenimonas oryziterrae DSM 21050 = YC6267]
MAWKLGKAGEGIIGHAFPPAQAGRIGGQAYPRVSQFMAILC